MTDNGSCYRSHLFAAALGESIRHRRTRPGIAPRRTARSNGSTAPCWRSGPTPPRIRVMRHGRPRIRSGSIGTITIAITLASVASPPPHVCTTSMGTTPAASSLSHSNPQPKIALNPVVQPDGRRCCHDTRPGNSLTVARQTGFIVHNIMVAGEGDNRQTGRSDRFENAVERGHVRCVREVPKENNRIGTLLDAPARRALEQRGGEIKAERVVPLRWWLPHGRKVNLGDDAKPIGPLCTTLISAHD